MEKKRIYLYDNVKFLLILFVVIGHFIDFSGIAKEDDCFKSAFFFIYSFHMPLFIFIGGLFYKAKDIASKVFAFLGIGMLLVFLLYLTSLIRNGEGKVNLIYVGGVPWYMFAMATFMIITYAFRSVDKRLMLILAVIIACFAGYCDDIGDKFVLSRIIVFYPFYLAGTMTKRESMERLAKKKTVKLISAVIIIAFMVICSINIKSFYEIRPLLTGRNPFNMLAKEMQPYGGLYRLLCYGVSALLCFAVIGISSTRKLPLVTKLGKRTLQIYFWHSPLIYFIMMIPAVHSLTETSTGSRWAFVALSLPLTLLLSMKPFAFPTDLIMKHSKSKEISKN